eukprot:s2147_g8.t1
MVSLESKAAWEARARAIGTPEGFIIELQNGNLDSFGQWAFCCSCDQNSMDDTPISNAVQTLIGRDVTPQEMVFCRRLYFEGRTYAISDMQSRIERTSDDKPRTMPLAERMARIERQKGDLVGVTWTAELQPAHKLVDKIVAMQEDGNLLFIPPNACISRVQEIQQEKHELALTFDASGSIRMGKKAEDLKCDTNGDLNLRNAWTRRNLAYDQAGLASFVVLEKWTTKLVLSKLKEPPAGFRYITTQQICECDREMWLQLAQLSRGQLQPPAPDVRPLDTMIEQLTTSPEVLCFLAPLQGRKRDSTESTEAPGPKKPKATPSAPSAPSKPTPKPADQTPAGVNWRKLPAGCQGKGASGWRCLKYQWGLCNRQKEGKCKFGIHECYKCSGAFSLAMKNAGCQVFAVDHQANRFTPKVPTLAIDLSIEDEVTLANQLLTFVKPDAVHFGLMCGTCSRAREHSLAPSLRRQGAPEPKPLRDEANLFGKPGMTESDRIKVADNLEEQKSENLVKVGVYLEPEQHMFDAGRLSHPMDTSTVLPDDLKRALFSLLTREPADLARERLNMLKYYRERATALHEAEVALHKQLPQHFQGVVQGKRLLLFEERLIANSFPDMQVMRDFKRGVDLVGEEPASDLFLEKLQPATLTVQQLDLFAEVNRRLVMGRPLASHDSEHADRLAELSQEEGEEGKERIIDDYRRSHVNSASASRSYLELQDVDVFAALLTLLMKLLHSGPKVELALSDGTILSGHLSNMAKSKAKLVGRCFDLSKAYKQMAVSCDSLRYSVLGARDSKGKWSFYIGQSLPFGSTASVFSFNKMARALQFLLWRDFGVVTTNFYDDYPTVEFDSAAESTTCVVSSFLQMLGWKHAVSGKKAKPFSECFSALGVEYNLSNIHTGSFTIGNKPERLQRIQRMIEQVHADQKLTSSTAASIHGLLNFASSFALGKALQPAAQGFSTLATGATLPPGVLRELCEHALSVLQSIQPRTVAASAEVAPILIYTDGAFDGDLADWGAILLDPVTGMRLCFAGKVPCFLLEAWKHLVGEQLICQIEMFAVLCIRWQARHLLHNRRALLFIDNEPCRYCLIKGRSPSDPLFRMAHACSCLEGALPGYLWFERIASFCNPADLPSRRKHLEACQRWSLDFCGDVALPAVLLTSTLDGSPFPQITKESGDVVWTTKQRGKSTVNHKTTEVLQRQTGCQWKGAASQKR